ncbi:MAG: hypothetical protein ACOWWR_03650 [Eubacteriales bacterium]
MNILALVLSVLSIIVAFFTLGWTIYRDVYIKPRSKVTAMIANVHASSAVIGPYISITILNMGPGKMYIETIIAKLKKKQNGAGYIQIINDYRNPANPILPTEILPDNKTTQFLPFGVDCILKENIKKLGFIDSLGRYHWVRNKDVKELKDEYRKISYLEKESQ